MSLAGPASPAYLLYHSLWCAVDWLYPPTCGGCSRPAVRWCEECRRQVRRVSGDICPKCGNLPLPSQTPGVLCPNCLASQPEFEMLRSYGEFNGPLREAIHRLKYQRDIGLGEALSKHLIEIYNEFKWEIDLVVPVPLGAKRAKERGYNQSGLLGRPLAYALQKRYLPGAIYRERETRSQVGLSAKDRKENVKGAFKANPKQVQGKAVLVIDDVTTTGSTISACAQALRQAGASAVFGLTLARAVLQADADDLPNPSYQKRR